MGTVFDKTWKILVFMFIQYTLGRRGSFPYGLLIKFHLIQIVFLITLCDLLQTVFLLTVFEGLWKSSTTLQRFQKWLVKERNTGIRVPGPFRNRQSLILVFLSALPFGGGALTGSLVAVSLKMERRIALPAILFGCILGTSIFYLGIRGILMVC